MAKSTQPVTKSYISPYPRPPSQPYQAQTEKELNDSNILLLTCGTGEGHNHATLAVAEELEQRRIPYAIENPLSLCSQRTGKLVDSIYNRMIQKSPRTFNFLYKAGSLYESTGRTSPVYWAIAHCADGLNAYICGQCFSAIICTHLFAMEAMAALRNNGLCTIPCYGLLTDYTCIPFVQESRLDGYFVPHSDMEIEMEGKGIPKDLIHATGIPISRKFIRYKDKAAARQNLGIPKDHLFLLIMGGGAGSGNPVPLCRELLKYPGRWQIGVMTGRNHDMMKMLKRQFSGERAIIPIPYTDGVDSYMAAADVLITKPGGLTSTEAAVVNIPLVHLLNYKACETGNAEFFSSRGMSVWAKDEKEAAAAAWKLTVNREERERMLAAQRHFIPRNAAEDIVESVMSL
jgi:processive 1,2-diacylglycerol beta-glucosyltransferase